MSAAAVSSWRGWVAVTLLTAFTVAAAFAVAAAAPLVVMVFLALALAGLAAATMAAGGRWSAMAGAVLLAVGLGVVRGAIAVHHPGAGTLDGHLGRAAVVVSGTVRDSIEPGPSGAIVVDAVRLDGPDGGQPVAGGLLVPARSSTALPGDLVNVTARGLRAPGRRPGPRSEAALARIGVEALAVSAQVMPSRPGGGSLAGAVRSVRARIVATVDALLPEPTSTLLLGIAFGLRQRLDTGLTAALQDAGLFHLLVVSGLKVILVAGMVRAVAQVRGWSRRWHLAAAAATVGAYVLVSGAGVAAVRSAVMAGIAMTLRRGGRRADPLPVLALVAAGMVALDPHVWSDVGFQLSFLGTAGILLLAGRIGERLPGPRLLAEPFAVTVAAQLATLPVMAGTFGVISLVGPAANAVALPLLPALILVGLLGAIAGMVAAPVGWLLLHLGAAGIDLTVLVARVTAALPGAALHVGEWPTAWTLAELAGGLGVAAIVGPAMVHRHRRAASGTEARGAATARRRLIAAAVTSGALCAASVLAVAGRPDGRLHVTVLDAGAATAVLLRTAGGELALVDGGADPAALTTGLGRALSPAVQDLDLVVMTGGDRASVAGLAGLVGRYRVHLVATPPGLGTGASAVLGDLQRGGAGVQMLDDRSWVWGGVRWRCLPVVEQREGGPLCVLHVAARGGSALVLGGATLPDQEDLAAMYGPELGADLLVTAPALSAAPALVDAVHPSELAEPSAHSLRAAPSRMASVALTGVDGDLHYRSSGTRLERA